MTQPVEKAFLHVLISSTCDHEHRISADARVLPHHGGTVDRTGRRGTYLHGEGRGLLVVVVQYVGHVGGVVGKPLAHAKGYGLTSEQTVALHRRVHGDGDARRHHGHRQQPQETHGGSVRQEREQPEAGRPAGETGLARLATGCIHRRGESGQQTSMAQQDAVVP